MADNKTQAEKDAEKANEQKTTKEAAAGSPGTEGTSGAKSSGKICTVLCNLPHGLWIEHQGLRFHIRGANANQKGGLAIHKAGLMVSGTWGVTSGVNREVMEDWKKNAPKGMTKHFEIMEPTSTVNDWEEFAKEVSDEIRTGADGLVEQNLDPNSAQIDQNQL